MKIIQANTLNHTQKLRVCELWNSEYPSQLAYSHISEFDDYLKELSDTTHYLLTQDDHLIVGWAFAFKRDNEQWFAIIIDAQVQGKGYGKLMLGKLNKEYSTLNGWVVDHNDYSKADGRPYHSPLEFYLKNGFEVIPEKRIENDQTSAVMIRKSFS